MRSLKMTIAKIKELNKMLDDLQKEGDNAIKLSNDLKSIQEKLNLHLETVNKANGLINQNKIQELNEIIANVPTMEAIKEIEQEWKTNLSKFNEAAKPTLDKISEKLKEVGSAMPELLKIQAKFNNDEKEAFAQLKQRGQLLTKSLNVILTIIRQQNKQQTDWNQTVETLKKATDYFIARNKGLNSIGNNFSTQFSTPKTNNTITEDKTPEYKGRFERTK